MTQITISKSAIKRLLLDVKEIIKNPLETNGIYYKHDSTDMLKGTAMIIGPQDTPYQYGYYLFKFKFPSNYPFAPPKVEYMTNDGRTRFNPNLYRNGKVCVSILNTWSGDQWTGCQTISSVLLTLCTLLNDNPLLNEPGIHSTNKNIIPYNNILRYKNFEHAIYKIITKKMEVFSHFYPIIIELFLKNYNSILEKINEYKKKCDKCTLNTNIYRMETYIDYDTLIQNLKKIFNTLNSNKNDLEGENI